ncbi:MAG TPA: hypothetical protein VGZ04_00995 [Acidimicrobiales bacterium]|jgi:hypothetical protein|nr:hypothetical protein [Acidimicrobiales bacterium]
MTAIDIVGEGISLSMLPERGGKITSLVDVERSREWLEQPSRELVGSADESQTFDEGDMCGWDEMMPTIAPCQDPSTGVSLPGHGDLWRRPWEVTARDRRSVSTRVTGDALAYSFERTVTLGVRSLQMEYRAKNQGDTDLQFLWATHPLFSVLPATKVVLCNVGDVQELHVAGDMAPWTWPEGGVSVVDTLTHGQGKKFFARATTGDATASMVDGDGGALTMRWRSSAIPWLGIWLDNCSLSRGPVAAIEPTNASDDSLEVAARTGQSWSLPRGAELFWSVGVTVSGTVTAPR